VLVKKSPKNAAVFNINAGTQVFPNTYAELEFAYANHKFNSNYMEMDEFGNPASVSASFKTRVKTMSGFANLSYRFENLNIMVIPYITAGVGVSSNKVDNMTIARNSPTAAAVYSPTKTTTQAAWQIGGGLLMPVSKSIAVNLSYKYRDLGKIKTSTQATISGLSANTNYPFLQGRMGTSNILLGMNINF